MTDGRTDGRTDAFGFDVNSGVPAATTTHPKKLTDSFGHPSVAQHGGHPVSKGERYIVGAFILIEDKVEHVRRLNNQGRDARGRGDSEKAKRLYEYGLAINPHCVT